MPKMKCPACKKEIGGRGIFDHGLVFCSDDCADHSWRNGRADAWARNESQGIYLNYEDYMENEFGATIADDHIRPANWGPYGPR